jgi:hypothetical protein
MHDPGVDIDVLMDDCERRSCSLFSANCLAGWQAPTRDPSTNAPVADPSKFPNGVKDLSDKIHAMGLKV